MTYTYALLKVSREAYDEIADMLRRAGYDHAFHDGAIDMHGIGLVKAIEEPIITIKDNPHRIENTSAPIELCWCDIERAFK